MALSTLQTIQTPKIEPLNLKSSICARSHLTNFRRLHYRFKFEKRICSEIALWTSKLELASFKIQLTWLKSPRAKKITRKTTDAVSRQRKDSHATNQTMPQFQITSALRAVKVRRFELLSRAKLPLRNRSINHRAANSLSRKSSITASPSSHLPQRQDSAQKIPTRSTRTRTLCFLTWANTAALTSSQSPMVMAYSVKRFLTLLKPDLANMSSKELKRHLIKRR